MPTRTRQNSFDTNWKPLTTISLKLNRLVTGTVQRWYSLSKYTRFDRPSRLFFYPYGFSSIGCNQPIVRSNEVSQSLSVPSHDVSRKVSIMISVIGDRRFSVFRLFYGFYDQSDENNLNGNVPFPQLLLRFDELDKQQSTVNPAIIFVIRDGSAGQIRRACLDGKGFVNDVCRCLCEAGEIKDQSVWISTGSGRVTFEALTRYHGERTQILPVDSMSSHLDDQLKQPDEIWTKDGEIFYALDFLLRETMQVVTTEISSRW